MLLGIRYERPCKDGIINLLLIQWLASDVDGLKPLQFLTGVTLTYIDGQRIVQNLALNILGLIEEVLILIRELTCHIFTECECALLTIHYFVGTISIVRALHPVHYVQRIAVQNRCDDSLLFFLIVDKLTLIGWANVELAIITANALFVVIHVTEGNFTDSHFSLGNSHHSILGFLLRMNILENATLGFP